MQLNNLQNYLPFTSLYHLKKVCTPVQSRRLHITVDIQKNVQTVFCTLNVQKCL